MSLPYVPFYTSDFLGGTSGMTAATRGVYITLLCLIYDDEAPLPQNWETLARRCGCTLPAFKKAVEALVDDKKIEILEAGIWSQKCEKHIALRGERSDSARAAANKRWKKSEQKQGRADANAMQAECQPEPEPDIKPEGLKPLTPFEVLTGLLRPETAEDFIAHRKAMKKAITEVAAKRIVSKLSDHPDPDAVVDESIANGWAGVFPQSNSRKASKDGQASDMAKRVAKRFTERRVASGEGAGSVVPLLPAGQRDRDI